MKKLLSIVLILVMSTGIMMPVMARQEITIVVNGKQIDFDTPPFIEDGRTMVPMRAIFEAMEAEVTWHEEEDLQTATASRYPDKISFSIGQKEIYDLSCSVIYPCEVAPRIVNDRTFVPLRAIGEAFDCDVNWDEETKTVTVDDKKQPIKITYKKESATFDTADEYAKLTVNYIYPTITNGEDFLNPENVEKLNQLILEEKDAILNAQKYADSIVEFLPVIFEDKLYNYPDISLNITSELFTSEKYGTVSIRTWFDALWTGAEINTVTLDKDTLEKKDLAQCFPDENPQQLYDEIFDKFVKNFSHVRYGRNDFEELQDQILFVISEDDLYVYMSSIYLTGVGRYTNYFTSITEH